jgi:signal recognition particle subunit SRP54
LMGMMPGIAKMKNQIANAGLDEKIVKRQMAIIDSMTPRERRNPDVLKASRKRRIAEGSGTRPEDINRLLKMHRGMADMMKAMANQKRGPMAGLAQAMGFGGGMPSPEEMQKLAEKIPGALPPNLPGAPQGMPAKMPGMSSSLPPNFPGTLPGLGPKMPNLGGFPGFGKKK